jgi:hypothetical protein
MVKTKGFQSQLQYADGLRKSKRQEDQARYWDMGMQYVVNGLESLRDAKRGDGSIQKVEGRRYVDYVDAVKYLNAEAEKGGLKITRETSNGEYKLTRINGDGAVPLFTTWATSLLSGNNQLNDVFRVEGSVLFENKVKVYVNNGMDPATARSTLATDYLKGQADNYKTLYDNLSSSRDKLQAKIDRKQQEAKETPSMELYNELKEMYQQLDNADEQLPSYQKMMDWIKDPTSKEYADHFNSIVNNGEGFFAGYSRSNLIANWAKGRASNSSVQYDIDPAKKLNLELEKAVSQMQNARLIAEERITHTVDGIRYDRNGRVVNVDGTVDGSSGSGGSSGGGTAADRRLNVLNTPHETGLNVYGRDPVEAYNRFVSTKGEYLHGYMDTGLSFINQMGFKYGSSDSPGVSAEYLSELKEQMLTGKYTNNKSSLKEEHQRLQKAGLIPENLSFGEGPMRTYAAIKGFYTDMALKQMKNHTASPEIVQMLDQEERFADKYRTLQKAEDVEIAALKKDPQLKDFFVDGDKFMTKEEYLKSKFKTADKDEYISDYMKKNADKMMPARFAAIEIGIEQEKFDDEEKLWNSKVAMFKEKFGKLNITKQDEAYISPTVRLNAGKESDVTLAKAIAEKALGPQNFTEQKATKSGLAPLNIEQLTQDDGKQEEVLSFLKRVRGDIGSALSGVDVTKIGSQGNASVRLQFSRSVLDSYTKGTEHLISNETANALGNHGIEIEIKDPSLLRSLGIDLKFTPSTLDVIELSKDKGVVRGSQVLKSAGFDYSIQKDYSGQNLLIKMNYPKFVNGNTSPEVYTRTIPIQGADFDAIREDLFRTAFRIYDGNYEAARTYRQQKPQLTAQDFQKLADQHARKN